MNITHDHEADALPQAHGLTMPSGEFYYSGWPQDVAPFKRGIASGKSGPAFDTQLATELAASLQTQTLVAAGNVLRLCESLLAHGCQARTLKELFPAWAQLLRVVKPIVRRNDISRITWMTRESAVRSIRTVVLSALCHADEPSLGQWETADMVVRAAAAREVASLTDRLDQGVWEDDSHFTPEMVVMLTAERDFYAAFASGEAA